MRKVLNEDYAVTINIKLDAALTASKVGNLTTTCYFLNESVVKLQIIKPSFKIEIQNYITTHIRDINAIIDINNEMITKSNFISLREDQQKRLKDIVELVKTIIQNQFPQHKIK